MILIKSALIVGMGGFIGAISRFLMVMLLRPVSPVFPLGTFTVNIIGCFFIGVCITALNQTDSNTMHYFVITGILGSLTTFSTFMYEAVYLTQNHSVGFAILYVGASLVVGGVFLYVGLTL